jgi:hypothetical protein
MERWSTGAMEYWSKELATLFGRREAALAVKIPTPLRPYADTFP